MDNFFQKVFYIFGGIFGASSFAAYAASAHVNGFYGHIAPILLGNALALLFLANICAYKSIYKNLLGISLIIGVSLFCGDLLLRQFIAHKLFPYAAPTGGMLIIIAWLGFIFLPYSKHHEKKHVK